ncbi:ArdC family protein [Janthinobacterium rivuli]|uniref:ArdC family protein n=1 Tax=Janthinobacterium rivuli TaxID=2751478 RepID=UPI00383A48DF
MKKGSNYCDDVAKQLITLLERGTAPWQKPWAPSSRGTTPYNIASGRRYKGINSLNLMAQPYEDPRWMTFKQANFKGARIKKNERGTAIRRWIFSEATAPEDSDDFLASDSTQPAGQKPKMYFTTVFNAEQVNGLDPLQPAQLEFDPIERAERILWQSGATIKHDQRDQAYYDVVGDEMHLPPRCQFNSAIEYYAVALHELGHWSGHSSRLNRDLFHPFGSPEYAYEELCAEIASMMLGDELALGHDPSLHAAYVGSWIKVIRDDSKAIFRACTAAEKIRTFVLELGNSEGELADERSLSGSEINDLSYKESSGRQSARQA